MDLQCQHKREQKARSWIIRDCISKWEIEPEEPLFDKCLVTVKETNLKNVTELTPTIRRFLYGWGKMGRVLGRTKYVNWEKRLEEKISLNSEKLEKLRNTNLLGEVVENYENDIKEMYEAFSSVVGPIAAAKTLHLICPGFFPLWDNPIAIAFRNERKTICKGADFSPEDYYGFMKDIKNLAEKYDSDISDLASKDKTGKLRVIDKLAWWLTHRPLSLLL